MIMKIDANFQMINASLQPQETTMRTTITIITTTTITHLDREVITAGKMMILIMAAITTITIITTTITIETLTAVPASPSEAAEAAG